MKKNSQFIMNQEVIMVQWHRSFRSESNHSLWTQNLFNDTVLKYYRTGYALAGKRNACSTKILINN